ncbi:MAG: DUF6351 family protein [Microthrixaceae bacterium]|nr:DUF6351 family protein [Microthrixaceae bacterium]
MRTAGEYYRSDSGKALSPQQRTAINGHLSGLTCVMWEQTFVPVADPARCGFGDAAGAVLTSLPGLSEGLPTVPEDQAYDPETNPDGLRCTMQDSYPQVFDKDPETGFAERPIDNTGVQYGLEALNDGVIDVEEFLDLNEGVGGMDLDANPIPERMVAEADTIERLYETGRITSGGPLLEIPVIVTNTYTDPEGDIHDRFRMFSMNERLMGEDGEQAPGYVMWTRPSPARRQPHRPGCRSGRRWGDRHAPARRVGYRARCRRQRGPDRAEALPHTPRCGGQHLLRPRGRGRGLGCRRLRRCRAVHGSLPGGRRPAHSGRRPRLRTTWSSARCNPSTTRSRPTSTRWSSPTPRWPASRRSSPTACATGRFPEWARSP